MTDHYDVFLSYSRNDVNAAALLRAQLERAGLSVFKDDKYIRASDLWLDRLQQAVDSCNTFVVLVGRDGVRRWIGAEIQVALNRYFGPHDDDKRLLIVPILLGETQADTLPAFLRLFPATPWNGTDPLPERLLHYIRERTTVADTTAAFEGCPFVGLAAYRPNQAHLFFGRQKETLDALACFNARAGAPTVRWLEINGNSGSGKSSLMQAGLLPLVDQGWLWPHTGFAHWRRIGPMMPGEHPVEMLAECLARTFNAKMGETIKELRDGDDALRYWLREMSRDEAAFLLAIDQFEELFTFADPNERRRFDRLLAGALEDADCPLFLISTVRSDFLDRFAEDLPRLVAVRNRAGRPWTLAPIGDDGLREVIEGPAWLAGLDISEVKAAMVAEARDEPGALPLVENALHWLWEQRTDNRLSGELFTEQGGSAGILSRSADALLDSLGTPQRDRALELLFRLVQVDPEGRRHTRRRMPLDEAIAVAGGGEAGRALVDRLAGQRRPGGGTAEGPLRLITITDEAQGGTAIRGDGRWVNLIHERLICSKGSDVMGKPQPYWPTLWTYIEQHMEWAVSREHLIKATKAWQDVPQGNIPLAWLNAATAFYRQMDDEARSALLARRLSARCKPVETSSAYSPRIDSFRLPDDFILNMADCLVVLPTPKQPTEDVVAAVRRLDGLHDRVCVLVSTDTDQLRDLKRFGDDPSTMLVVPGSADLTQLLLSPEPLDAFARMVARQVSITRLSPYQSRGGVKKESIFFGRAQLLAHIVNREPANYLLVGGRQLGKSSLLKAIEPRYRKRGSLDCRYCSVGDMPIQVVLAQTLGLSEDADMVRVVRELGAMPNGQRRLMLLDECDVFLAAEEEKGFETLSAFRSLSEEGRCFFILAGFWRLFEAASLDYQSRIRNFGETLTIGALEAEACRELITKPMAALNLEYASDILVERIIQETGRRANLVAITCNEILAGLGREARTVSETDVVRPLASPAVGDALSGWENLAGEEQSARLDRIIIYATARCDGFSLRDVLAILDDASIAVTIEEIRRSLRRLDLAFIIGEEGGRYRYRVPLFQRMIHKTEADLLLERELREARSEAQPASVTSHPRARDKA